MPKLKPCPFCGGENVVIEYETITGTYVIRCKNCQTIVWQYYAVMDEAIEAWNRRAAEDKSSNRRMLWREDFVE